MNTLNSGSHVSKPIVLCILDGWGVREDAPNNGINENAPNWQKLMKHHPHTTLQASEHYVGLPDGQMGNSEVGHMCIGLGRTILQDLPKINKAIDDKTIPAMPNFKNFVENLKKTGGRAHILGLLSDGGVHSHQHHMIEISKILMENGVPVVWHCFLDGRDTSPQSALKFMTGAMGEMDHKLFQIGSIGGRYFGMDRDKRWDRVMAAYDVMTNGDPENAFQSPLRAIQHYYDLGTTDEFIPPLSIGAYDGMHDGDGLFMMNFRADRARQILSSLLLPEFKGFERKTVINFSATLGMNAYADYLTPHIPSLFERDTLSNGLGEFISAQGINQLRISETEKYAHVTFFFNGGVEKPFDGEERILIPSPQVATYDLKPEMASDDVCNAITNAMEQKHHGLIVVNFANTDMVGHTGNREAIAKAVSAIDGHIQTLSDTAIHHGWTLCITADHGNAEETTDKNGDPHTAHTLNPVPFLVINGPDGGTFKSGTLSDIAPTLISLMGYDIPREMTGQSLLIQT